MVAVWEPKKKEYQVLSLLFRDTQRQFSKNICSEDDLRSRNSAETFL